MRLPAKKMSTDFVYVNLPKDLDQCFWKLKLVEFRLTDKKDKFVYVWKVLKTDLETIEKGSQASTILNPGGEWAEQYFWTELLDPLCALRGVPGTKTERNALIDDAEDLIEELKAGDYNGLKVLVEFTRVMNPKTKRSRVQALWSPVGT